MSGQIHADFLRLLWVLADKQMTPTTDLGLSIRLSMFELRETGDWDIFLGPSERARAETVGADQWVKAKGMLRVCQGESSNSRIP